MRPWEETGVRTLVTTRVFELEERRSINPRTGQEHPFYVLESGPWVNVIPLTEEGRVIMVRQYRQGTRTITLEIPGGMAEPGEDPAVGARRELLEETGYAPDEMIELGSVQSNPAIQSNSTYTYLATGLRKIAELDPDGAEDLEVVEVELAEIDDLIRRGEITHSLVVAAFYWLQLHDDSLRRVEAKLAELGRDQLDRLAVLAKNIDSRLTPDDLLSPRDIPELAVDPEFNYQDGVLTGIESARTAVKRIRRGSSR